MNWEEKNAAPWTFLTNHSHVLILLAQYPEKRIRDIAAEVEITERAVQRIIAELVDAGYVTIDKIGRRNRYDVDQSKRLRHPVESHCTIGDLMRMIQKA